LFFSFQLDEKRETKRLQESQAARYSIGTFSMIHIETPKWMQEPYEKNVLLEDRLENDNEFDVTGILNLSGMNVTDDDLPVVIQRAFTSGPKKCTGLLLRDNALTADGVRMIVDTVLAARTNLRYLSFSSNPDIGDAGIKHIVRLLQKNRSMVFLSLPRTGMTDHGVRLLADVLCGADSESTDPPSLKKLYISSNKAITDASLEPLLQILEKNQNLKLLSVQHCSLSDKAHRTLRQAAIKLKKKKFSLTG
jgi:Ran GTPase-activating protein (RanGAP) involved in mRNA processing and transport